jgi:hypothetical protein
LTSEPKKTKVGKLNCYINVSFLASQANTPANVLVLHVMDPDMESGKDYSVVTMSDMSNIQDRELVASLMEFSEGARKRSRSIAPEDKMPKPNGEKYRQTSSLMVRKLHWEQQYKNIDKKSQAYINAQKFFPVNFTGRKDMPMSIAVKLHEMYLAGIFSRFDLVEVGSKTPCCLGGIVRFRVKSDRVEDFARGLLVETCGWEVDWVRYREGDAYMGLDDVWRKANPSIKRSKASDYCALVANLSSDANRYCLKADVPSDQRVGCMSDAFRGRVDWIHVPYVKKPKP